MKSNKIDASFIQYAADILGDTNTGLTGGEIVKYCNSYAIEFNVNIPIISPDFGGLVPNKRTALYKNLVEFSACQQFKIIKELCEVEKFSNNDNVKKLKARLYERFEQFDNLVNSAKTATSPQEFNNFFAVIKVLLDIYNNSNEIYLTSEDKRFSHIDNYEKILKRLSNQGYFASFKSDVLGGYEIELSDKCFTYLENSKMCNCGIITENEKEVPTVFISYNWANSDFVDKMEISLAEVCNVKRDKNAIEDWGSITSFMNTIRKQDFAVLVITDGYLKSTACIYEVIQLMKNENWDRNTMYVVMNDAKIIYNVTEQLKYIKYWTDYYESLSQMIRELPPESTCSQSEELKKASIIKSGIGEFLSKVADSNNPSVDEVISKIKHRINPIQF